MQNIKNCKRNSRIQILGNIVQIIYIAKPCYCFLLPLFFDWHLLKYYHRVAHANSISKHRVLLGSNGQYWMLCLHSFIATTRQHRRSVTSLLRLITFRGKFSPEIPFNYLEWEHRIIFFTSVFRAKEIRFLTCSQVKKKHLKDAFGLLLPIRYFTSIKTIVQCRETTYWAKIDS